MASNRLRNPGFELVRPVIFPEVNVFVDWSLTTVMNRIRLKCPAECRDTQSPPRSLQRSGLNGSPGI
jgi:hypothetical protein